MFLASVLSCHCRSRTGGHSEESLPWAVILRNLSPCALCLQINHGAREGVNNGHLAEMLLWAGGSGQGWPWSVPEMAACCDTLRLCCAGSPDCVVCAQGSSTWRVGSETLAHMARTEEFESSI